MKTFLQSRRAELIAAVLALGIATLFAFQVVHFSHRNDAEREVWTALPFWQTLESFEYRLYDARFYNRGLRTPKSLDKIAIVGVDEDALTLANWPFPRSMHAQLIRKLKQAGARVIALDFDFSQSTPGDKPLEDAMRESGNVLLPSYITPESKLETSGGTSTAAVLYRTTTPFEYFDEYTPDLALVYIPLDSDGRARRYPLYAVLYDSNIGSLAALAAASYQGLTDGRENPRYEKALSARQWPVLNGRAVPVPVTTSRSVETKRNKDAPLVLSTPLYFYGPRATFKTYSYADVLQGDDREYSAQGLKEKFGGKIVFVGATTHILKDNFEIPSFASDALTQSQLPGVEIHATATAMLLDGNFIRAQSTRGALWTLFGFTLFASLWAASLRGLVSRVARGAQVLWTRRKLPGQIHTPLWFALYLALGALPIVLFWRGAQWLFTNANYWLIAAYPLLSASASTVVVLLFLFGVESAERRKTEAHFARHVAPEVMAKMLAAGEDFLKPERVRLTVLFSDLEGFTTYSEAHSPEQVVEVTNEYLSRMVPIVRKHGGCVDKYIGDAIMAFFGAPLEYSDHAARALRCAVEMQDACASFRRETGIPFYMRIGIHTGEVIAGDIGSRACANSPERMDYTVIGDTVNLASRLEGKNKEFGSWVMCSAQTFAAAPDVVSAESVSASIKGKSKEVEVFIVRGLKDDPERDKNWAKDAI